MIDVVGLMVWAQLNLWAVEALEASVSSDGSGVAGSKGDRRYDQWRSGVGSFIPPPRSSGICVQPLFLPVWTALENESLIRSHRGEFHARTKENYRKSMAQRT